MQAGGPELGSPAFMYVLGRVRLACNSRLWGGDKEISGVHWSASLAKLMTFRSPERPVSKYKTEHKVGRRRSWEEI